ncbi:MAG TPA: AAA family ATPase [Kofleriaceae bacterium]|nr:AAA family ATPase [Kofleriaceae bacterium]
MLVGRREELGLVEAALDRAGGGRAALVLVSGEPGIGKSRLAEEAAAMAERREMMVGWGRAWEAGGAPAFWPWIQLLRALRRSSAGAGADVADLARLLPEVGEAPGGESPEDRFAMFDAVLRFVTACTRRRPALLVLEDLHAADAASLQLLVFAAAHLRDAALAVIGTYRPREARLAPLTGELLERAGRDGQTIALRPLERDDVARLVAEARTDARTEGRSVAGTAARELGADAIGRLHQATGGNPLFIVELLRLLPADAGQPIREPLPVPASARALVRERLVGLSAARRALLEAAATVGRELAAPLLASLCGRPLAEVVADLDAAVEAGLLVERSPGRHVFSHELYAEALRQDLPAERRAALHLAIAGELERLHLGDPAAPLAEIAHHMLGAGPAAAPRAVECARAAADAAVRALAFEQAAALLDRAAAASALVDPPDAVLRADLLLALGRARILAGDLDAGHAACLEVAGLARSLAAPELLARAAIEYGAAFTFGRTDAALVALIEEALRALPGADSPLRARLLARLAAALQPSLRPEQPIAIAREAIDMARRLGDERTRLDVFHAASASLVKYGPPGERVAIDDEARKLATRLGEPSLALRAHARLAFDSLEVGDSHTSLAHVQAYTELAGALGRPGALWPAAMLRAMFALYHGRFADQERELEEARGWIARAGDPLGPQCLDTHRIGSLRARGDDDALDGPDPQLWRQLAASAHIYHRVTRWMILARLRRTDELRAALAGASLAEVIALGDPVLVTWCAEAAAHARDRAWAEALVAWLEPRAAQIALQPMNGMFVEGPLSRPLFLVADALDRDDLVRAHAGRALAVARAHGARPLEARILWEWGTIRRARGDEDEGRASLERARELAASLGMPLAGAIAAALARAPEPPQRAAVAIAREGEVWTIRGEGGTIRMRDSRGLEMLARLVAQPGREIHALELTGAPAGAADSDAGEAIDRAARDSYRARLRDIEAERDQAEAWNDSGRAGRLGEEAAALRAELARGLGLGGRPRRLGSASERARVNAQRRLADAIRRVQERHAGLGAHLARCVRTGTYCSYDPGRPED